MPEEAASRPDGHACEPPGNRCHQSTNVRPMIGKFHRRRLFRPDEPLGQEVRKGFIRMPRKTSLQFKELEKLLYSVTEAASLLSCSRTTVCKFIRSGELLTVYPTSNACIPAGALVGFVEGKALEAREERSYQKRALK